MKNNTANGILVPNTLNCTVDMELPENAKSRFDYYSDAGKEKRSCKKCICCSLIGILFICGCIIAGLYISGKVSHVHIEYALGALRGDLEQCVQLECNKDLGCELDELEQADVFYTTKQGVECKVCPICIDTEDVADEDYEPDEEENEDDYLCPDMLCSNSKCKNKQHSSITTYIYYKGRKCWSCKMCLAKDEL